MKNFNKKYTIYLIKFQNTPIYVGRTTLTLHQRLLNHRNHTTSALYEDIQEYGIECFDIIKIDSADCTIEADEKERFWTKFYLKNFKLKNRVIGQTFLREAILKGVQHSKLKNKGRHLSQEHKNKISKEIINSSKTYVQKHSSIEKMKQTKKLKFEATHPKLNHKYIIYLLKYNNKNVCVKITKNIYCELQKLSQRGRLKNFIRERKKELFSLIEIDHDDDAKNALNKEIFWNNFFFPQNQNAKIITDKKFTIDQHILTKALNTKNSHFYVYSLIKNNKIFYIGYTHSIFDRIKYHFSGRSKLHTILTQKPTDIFDFDILSYCETKHQAIEIEKFYTQQYKPQLDNIQIGNKPSQKCIYAGGEAAKKKKLGMTHTKEHKKKISQGNKGKNIGFDRYTSVMIVNLLLDKIFIYGDFIKQEKFHHKIDKKLSQNVPYHQNDGYILAEHLNYNEAKRKLNKNNFALYEQYIIKPHKRIDKRKIKYKNNIFNSITDLSYFYNISYEQISLSIAKNENIYQLIK